MTGLSLSFLGTFQVKLDGKPITRFRSANVQGLLVYLAMQPQRPFPRDVLATLFWPDEPDRVARTNLRQTLYQLRKVLQDSDKRERPFLLVTRQTAQFNPAGNTTLDVRHFVQALAAQDVETAVSRYHGDLLPGFTCDSLEFEDWLRRERERLHGLALDALGQWTDRLIARHDFGAAKAAAQRQLTLEPWREAGHRQLMLALALDGNRQAALAQFETCRQILGEELGVEPETATAELAGRIAAGDSVRSSLARRMHNLPAPITPYFGRQEEQAMLQQRFRDPDYRLMTLVGEGGIGKSRLSLEVAWTQREQFADGVWFVPLAGVQGPPANGSGNLSPAARMRLQDDIATAIAEAMGLPVGGRESPGKQLLTLLRDRQTLLLLDNFEHLLAGADLVINLLQQSPQVFVICTSREPLNYVAEWVFPLERLPLPSRSLDDPHLSESAGPFDATTSPAVQLFVDRAQRANGRFALTTENQAQVVQLCRLVAGLPLALELAAALLRRHSLPQLIKAIEHSLDTLTTRRRDIPPRHRSMRAVFAGSWALLDADEQALFAGLSVFRGGFSPAAAHRVTGAQLWQLQALQEKSLLQAHGVDRFWLHELLRQYAAEQLDVSGRTTDIANRHSAHYLDGIIELAADLNGETPQVAAQQIAKELDNIRQAWQTAVNQGAVNRLLPALNTLSDFYQIRGLYREGLRLFGEAATKVKTLTAATPSPRLTNVLSRLLTHQAGMFVRLSNYPQAVALITEALPPANEVNGRWTQSRLYITWGEALWRQGKLTAAEAMLKQGLTIAEDMASDSLIAIAMFHLGIDHDLKGEHETSLTYLESAFARWQELGNRRLQGFALNSIGAVARRLSQVERAQAALTVALVISRTIEDRQAQSLTLNNLSLLATEQGDFTGAQAYLLQALQLAEFTGDRHNQALLQQNLAWNAKRAGRWDEVQRYADKALQLRRGIGDKRGEAWVLRLLGDVAGENGRFEEAQTYYQTALALSRRVGDSLNEQETEQALAELDVIINKKKRA